MWLPISHCLVHLPGIYVDLVNLTFDLLSVLVLGNWYFTGTTKFENGMSVMVYFPTGDRVLWRFKHKMVLLVI